MTPQFDKGSRKRRRPLDYKRFHGVGRGGGATGDGSGVAEGDGAHVSEQRSRELQWQPNPQLEEELAAEGGDFADGKGDVSIDDGAEVAKQASRNQKSYWTSQVSGLFNREFGGGTSGSLAGPLRASLT